MHKYANSSPSYRRWSLLCKNDKHIAYILRETKQVTFKNNVFAVSLETAHDGDFQAVFETELTVYIKPNESIDEIKSTVLDKLECLKNDITQLLESFGIASVISGVYIY